MYLQKNSKITLQTSRKKVIDKCLAEKNEFIKVYCICVAVKCYSFPTNIYFLLPFYMFGKLFCLFFYIKDMWIYLFQMKKWSSFTCSSSYIDQGQAYHIRIYHSLYFIIAAHHYFGNTNNVWVRSSILRKRISFF